MKYLLLILVLIGLWQCQIISQERKEKILQYDLVVSRDTIGGIDYKRIPNLTSMTLVIDPNCSGKYLKIALDEQIVYDSLLDIPQDVLAKGIEIKKSESAKKIHLQFDDNEIITVDYEHDLSAMIIYFNDNGTLLNIEYTKKSKHIF
jgi:hypothetical protein